MQFLKWSEVDFENESVNISPMTQNISSKEVRITMGKNGVMKEHKAPFAICVQVLKGVIDFEARGEVFRLNSLDMICLEANVPHSLHAIENSIVRLSLSQADSVQRINAVLR